IANVSSDQGKPFYSLASELGTSFINCIIHAPQVNGSFFPELTDRYDFIQINRKLRFNHLNTRLGKDLIQYYKGKGIAIKPQFISMLKSHHELESEEV